MKNHGWRRKSDGVALALVLVVAMFGGCANDDDPLAASEQSRPPLGVASTSSSISRPQTPAPVSSTVPSGAPSASDALSAPGWLGTRTLPTLSDGSVPPQTTPPELLDRRFTSVDTLPPPDQDRFVWTREPLSPDLVRRSTWREGCPVSPEDLRYLNLTFWGFDQRSHTGEMIVHADVADDVIDAFRALYDARFPIEEMRVVTPADLAAPPTGDGNNTTSFVCRPAVGTVSTFSQHAYGLAIDINPFHNPYVQGELVLPELATSYLSRPSVAGVIVEGDAVVEAFDRIGWNWGGRWSSLKDYQHFSLNGR